MTRSYCLLLAGLLLMAGCTTDEPDPVAINQGYDYYPLAQGQYAIYEVQEQRQLGSEVNTETYQIRERVDSAFTDLQNEQYFRVIRSRRNSATANWQDDSVIVVKKTNARVERQDNNERKVVLIFPLEEGRSWNPNLLTPAAPETWRYAKVDVPYTLNRSTGDTTYNRTLLVQQKADSSLVDVNTRHARYAREAGLIEQRLRTIRYNDTLIGQFLIEQAYTRTVKLLQRGTL